MQEINSFKPHIKIDAKEVDPNDERILKSIRIRIMIDSQKIVQLVIKVPSDYPSLEGLDISHGNIRDINLNQVKKGIERVN